MKTVTKFVVLMLMTLALLSTAGLAYAQEPVDGQSGGVRGEVTAVGESSLTVAAFNGEIGRAHV